METARAMKKIYEIIRTVFGDAQDVEIACDDECITVRKNYVDRPSVYLFGKNKGNRMYLEADSKLVSW